MKPSITIDEEFRSLIPALSDQEREQLTANVLKHGCRDRLVCWLYKGQRLLLDGHNRFEICLDNEIEFDTVEMEFANRDDAKDWIVTNQLGRRNLTPDQMAYLRGHKYEIAKKRHGERGPGKKSGQNGPSFSSERTRDTVSRETGVSPNTIRRDAKFTQAVDRLVEEAGPEVKRSLLDGTMPMSRSAAPAILEMPKHQLRRVADMVASKTAHTVDDAVKAVQPRVVSAVECDAEDHGKPQGIGVYNAHEAIACLKKIPAADPLRKRGLQIVKQWIEDNG